MVRRSFRFGLRLGLLFGVAVALVKTVQSRRTTPEATPPPAPWEPISEKPPMRPAEPQVRPAEPQVAEVLDEVGEPIMEFSEPEPTPEPVVVAPTETELRDPPAQMAPAPKRAAKKAAAPKAAAPRAAAPKKAAPAKKAGKKAAPPPPAWVEAQGGVCPPTHPVKAKMASRLFHLPGMFAYDRTKPDRCYLDAPTAVKDGFTSAKR